MSLGGESSSGSSELEGPQEAVGFLEVGSHCVDLIDKIFNCANAVLSQRFLDNGVGGKGDSLFIDFSESSFENEFSDGLSGRISKGDIGFNFSDHVSGGFVNSDEGSVVELP